MNVTTRKLLPERWRRRVFRAIDGWTEPGQITAEDVERWHDLLGEARAAIRTEVVVDARDQHRLRLPPPGDR